MGKPKIKKVLAEFLAEYDYYVLCKTISIFNVLVEGHRGYISLSEDDLIKKFYKAKEFIEDPKNIWIYESIENRASSRWQTEEERQKLKFNFKEKAKRLEVEVVEKFLFHD